MKLLELPFEIREHIYRYCKVSDFRKLSLCCSDLRYEIIPLIFCNLQIPYSQLNDIYSLNGKLEYLKFAKSLVIKDDQRETASWNDNALKNYNDILNSGFNIKKLYLNNILDNRLLKDTFLAGSHLENIEITCYHYFKGPCWSYISNCFSLRSVSLVSCKLSDGIISDISKQMQIEVLKIVDCHGFSQLKCLGSMNQLKSLTLIYEDRFTIDFISFLHNLKYLDFSKTPINNKDIELISSARNLETLKLVSCVCITHESITSVTKLKTLIKLDLSYCQIRDESFSEFHKIKNLSELSLIGCVHLSDTGIENLQSLKLTVLHLDGCQQLTDVSLKYLSELPLKVLTLNDCPLLTNSGMQFICSVKSLKTLELMKCSGISDTGLDYLSSLRLNKLKLTLTLFSGSAIKIFCEAACLKNHRYCGSYQHWLFINSF